jgi:hypothetical protein
MKFREHLTQPGLVIDLMTAVMLLAFFVLTMLFFIEVSSHTLYHRGPNWHFAARTAIIYAICYLVASSLTYLWKQRRKEPAK